MLVYLKRKLLCLFIWLCFYRLSALRTRAYENMVAVATCNYPDGQPDCNGHSTLFDGVPWLRDEPGVRDMCVMEAPGEPGNLWYSDRCTKCCYNWGKYHKNAKLPQL